jgi:hypothetical protein
MDAHRAVGKQQGRPFVEGHYGNRARRPHGKGVVIFTTICVVILLVFYAYFAWCLLTSS